MNKQTVQEAANKWGLSVRQVQSLCQKGKIPGAALFGKTWMIPANAQRPPDGRSKAARAVKAATHNAQPLIRKSPFLNMTDLYSAPGTADQVIASLEDYPEAQQLFAADIAYSRSEIDKVYAQASLILAQESGLYAMICGGMLLAQVAVWKGDIQLWQQAKRHIYDAPCKDDNDRDIIALSIASTDLSIRNTKDFPDWFCKGRFEHLPVDAHPAARVFYIKHLLIYTQELAAGQLEPGSGTGLGLMRFHPYVMEPMIAQAVVEKTVMAEIYLRLLCAITYRQTGDDANAAFHLDRAIRLCLADRLYTPLVEHRRQLGLFLDDRLALIDGEALKKVKALHKQLHAGWTKLHNAVLERTVHEALTIREREVARLAAYGLSNAEISRQLGLSSHTVNSLLNAAKNKIGVDNRTELGRYV